MLFLNEAPCFFNSFLILPLSLLIAPSLPSLSTPISTPYSISPGRTLPYRALATPPPAKGGLRTTENFPQAYGSFGAPGTSGAAGAAGASGKA